MRTRRSSASLAVLAAVIAMSAGMVGVALPGRQAAAAITTCDEGFETGTGVWTTWWAGNAAQSTDAAHSGSGSMKLTGNPGTAQRRFKASECTNIKAISFWARATADTVLFVKLQAQTTKLVGDGSPDSPWRIGSTWRQITVPVDSPSGVTMFLEAYPGAGALYIDDVVVEPLPVPASCVESFESGTGTWGPWWSGTVARSNARANDGAYSLELNAPDGATQTARGVIDANACPGTPLNSDPQVNFAFYLTTAATVHLKVMNPSTGYEDVWSSARFESGWHAWGVTLRRGSTVVGIEITGNGGPAYFDQFTTLTDQTAYPTVPTTLPPTRCNVGFDDDGDFSAWYSGTAKRTTTNARSTPNAVELTGNPATALVRFDTRACSPNGPTSFSVHLATSTGTARVFLKRSGQVFGPFQITSTYTKVGMSLGPGCCGGFVDEVGIEAYPSVEGATVFVDDLAVNEPGGPTTTAPPLESDCRIDNFIAEDGSGFNQWWSGTPTNGLFRVSGTNALRIDGTARYIVQPFHCSEEVTGVRLDVEGTAGDQLVVRRFDLDGTSPEAERLRFDLVGGVQTITVPTPNVPRFGTLLGFEVWRPGGGLSTADLHRLVIRSARAPQVGAVVPPPFVFATGMDEDSVTVTGGSGDESFELRVTLRPRDLRGRDPGRTAVARYSWFGTKGGGYFSGYTKVTGLSTLADGTSAAGLAWEGTAVACSPFNCSEPTTFAVPGLRPVPPTACMYEEYDTTPFVFGNLHEWEALDDGAPQIRPIHEPEAPGAAHYMAFGRTTTATRPAAGDDYRASAERTINANTGGDCSYSAVGSIRIDYVGNAGGAVTVELVDLVSGRVLPYVSGAPIPAGFGTSGIRVRVRFVGTRSSANGASTPWFGVSRLLVLRA